MEEIRVMEPGKSIFISFSFHDRIECFRFGGLYIVAIIKMARAPQAEKSALVVWTVGNSGCTYGGSSRNRISRSILGNP